MNRSTNTRKNSLRILSVIIILVIATVALLTGTTIAKYLITEHNDSLIDPKDFYFESDLLSVEGTNSYVLPEGVETITFNIKNYPDALRTSEVDIHYTWNLYDASLDPSAPALSTGNGTLRVADKNASITVNAPAAGTYRVEVESTAPYKKTMSATFLVTDVPTPAEAVSFTVNDSVGSPVVYLTISVTGYSGKISVGWPSAVIPDITDPCKAEMTYSAYSAKTYVFFKTDISLNYTDPGAPEKFTVTPIPTP